jgi:hypothetical protein
MSRTTSHPRLAVCGLLVLATGVFLAGCGDDGRVVQVAREAADRQAEQNRQIAHQNHQIAETTHELVAADADSRRELVALQQGLQTQQAQVARQRDVLEGERREIARKQFWDSALGPAIESLTVGLIWHQAEKQIDKVLYRVQVRVDGAESWMRRTSDEYIVRYLASAESFRDQGLAELDELETCARSQIPSGKAFLNPLSMKNVPLSMKNV